MGNSAYGYTLGISTLAGVYEEGCSVTSEVSLNRRTGMTLEFSATVSQAQSGSAAVNAATITPASFAAGISSASAAQGVTVPVPSADQISGVTVTVITEAPTLQPSAAPSLAPTISTAYSFMMSGYSASDFDTSTAAGQTMRSVLTDAFAQTVGVNESWVAIGSIADGSRRSSIIVSFVVSGDSLNSVSVNTLMTSTLASGFGQIFVATAAGYGLTVAAPGCFRGTYRSSPHRGCNSAPHRLLHEYSKPGRTLERSYLPHLRTTPPKFHQRRRWQNRRRCKHRLRSVTARSRINFN